VHELSNGKEHITNIVIMITNHKLPISLNFNSFRAKIVKNIFVQNPWASKCENGTKNNNLVQYK
jgi:hypothetical protein